MSQKKGLMSVLILAAGVAMLFFGLRDTWQQYNKKQHYETTTGYVSDVLERTGKDGRTYAAVYSYEVGEDTYTCQSTYKKKRPGSNDLTKIYYDPADPSQSFAKDQASTGPVLALVGLMFLLTSVLSWTGKLKGDSTFVRNAQPLLISIMFMGMGFGLCFGLCFGLKLGLSGATIALFLFGCAGLLLFIATVKGIVRGESVGMQEASDESQDVAGLKEVKEQLPESINNVVESAEDFYEEHKETIEKAENTIRQGKNLTQGIMSVIIGILFVVIATKMLVSQIVTASGGMSQYLIVMIVVLALIIAAGVRSIVKGIRILAEK